MLGDRRATPITLLIFSFVIVISLHIELAMGNLPPFYNIVKTEAKVTTWYASPDAITEPTTIIIVSPEENQIFSTNNMTLIVNIGIQPIYVDGANTHYIRTVSYKGDWMESAERIFYHLADGLMAQKITITINIDRVPNGRHNLTVYVNDSYEIETSSTVNFTIDTQEIVNAESNDYIQFSAFRLFSPLNRTYNSRFLTLNLTFGAAIGIKYPLYYEIDGKYEGTIPYVINNPNEMHVVNKATGFAELPELSEGSHKLTIHFIASGYQHKDLSYADTVYFTINTQLKENDIPEFPSWAPLILLLSITMLAVIYKRRIQNQGRRKQ